jgi:hypothetical protein
VRPSTLAALIATYALIGVLLSLATRDGFQYLIATLTALGVAFTLGASWPVHRNFAIAGLALGLALAAAMMAYAAFTAITTDEWYYGNRARLLINGVFFSFAILGGWSFVVSFGAGAAWLTRWLRRASVGAAGAA